MSKSLINNTLLQSIGATMYSFEGKPIGKIVEVTYGTDNHDIEYIILKSSSFFGRGNRFFSIPASSRFIDIANGDRIVLQLNKNDIPFAKGVAADECPDPNFKFGKSIFELYNYHAPSKKARDNSHTSFFNGDS